MDYNTPIMFAIADWQAEKIANHFKKNLNDLTDYEVSELLDRLIDELED